MVEIQVGGMTLCIDLHVSGNLVFVSFIFFIFFSTEMYLYVCLQVHLVKLAPTVDQLRQLISQNVAEQRRLHQCLSVGGITKAEVSLSAYTYMVLKLVAVPSRTCVQTN